MKWVLLVAALGAGCSENRGPAPGSTDPGQACETARDCGCWQCDCAGVTGLPGAAQLCVSGHCPTGAEACAPVCAIVGASLAKATSVQSCQGVP